MASVPGFSLSNVLPRDIFILFVRELSFLEGRNCMVRGCPSFFKTALNGWLGGNSNPSRVSRTFLARASSHGQAPPLQMLLVLTKAAEECQATISRKHHLRCLRGTAVHQKATGTWAATPDSHENILPKQSQLPHVVCCIL